jgi:hypothetical protein
MTRRSAADVASSIAPLGHHTPPWRHPPAGMPKQLRQVTDVHGPGGTGKSGVIHVLDLFLKERKFGRMAITAQTGVAGLAAARFLAPTLQKALGLFVCDQISFVSTKFIGLVEKRLRQLTGHLAPFGGVAVVLAGDMRQLSPVSGQLWCADLVHSLHAPNGAGDGDVAVG